MSIGTRFFLAIIFTVLIAVAIVAYRPIYGRYLDRQIGGVDWAQVRVESNLLFTERSVSKDDVSVLTASNMPSLRGIGQMWYGPRMGRYPQTISIVLGNHFVSRRVRVFETNAPQDVVDGTFKRLSDGIYLVP